MQVAAVERLRCPTCTGALELRAFTDPEDSVLSTGALLCDRCRIAYPVEYETPVMLRFRTPFHDAYGVRHAERLRELSGFELPDAEPRRGETAVQETFTDQWNITRDNELSFMYTHDELVELNRRVWLTWLDDGPRPQSVLDVGCGAGTETMALRDVTGAQELWGLDANLAVLQRRDDYRHVPGVHYVVSSLFDLPFERESFDFVYSQGVIHHTYSTEDAFESIASRVAPGGHLFVWVYGLDDHLTRGGASLVSKRANLAAETVLRPALSRAPQPLRDRAFDALTAVWHGRMAADRGHPESWTHANTNHALRDWLSPRYARRHGFNEMAEWFEGTGFRVIATQSPAAYRELFGRQLWGVGMTGVRA